MTIAVDLGRKATKTKPSVSVYKKVLAQNELFSLADNDREVIMKFNSYKFNAQIS